jgi:hypothetical protein
VDKKLVPKLLREAENELIQIRQLPCMVCGFPPGWATEEMLKAFRFD